MIFHITNAGNFLLFLKSFPFGKDTSNSKSNVFWVSQKCHTLGDIEGACDFWDSQGLESVIPWRAWGF